MLGTYDCDLIWKWGLCKRTQIKMRSLRWALIQCDWCPYKKRGVWTQTHMAEAM